MGAVGASAPMVFKVVGASTHTFLAIFSPIHLEKDKTKVNNSSFVQKMNPSTHALKFLAGALQDMYAKNQFYVIVCLTEL